MPAFLYAIAIVVLAGAALWIVAGILTQLRLARVAERTAIAERDLLREKIRLLSAQRQFEQAKTELSWNGYRKFVVARKAPECGDVCSFYLAPHDGKPLPPFHPGQYLTFQLNIPGQPKPLIRCYSLSDAPTHPDRYRVTIKRVPRPPDKPDVPPGLSSNFFHDHIKEGDILDVKAPGGHFFLDLTTAAPVVLIAGGVGLTPILSMLNAIIESGQRREVWFFYGVRNRAEHIQREHLVKLMADHPEIQFHVCYSNPTPEDQAGQDYRHAARVSVDLFKKLLPSNNYHFYICGPPPMMSSLTQGLKEWGVPEASVHFEAFGPASVKKTAPPAPVAPAGQTFAINFARSGKTVAWDGKAASLLDLAEASGVKIDSGCRAGNCGTCLVAMKSGEITYLHEPGFTCETGSCLTCCAVPKSDLALDA
jgi:hypothetical protein